MNIYENTNELINGGLANIINACTFGSVKEEMNLEGMLRDNEFTQNTPANNKGLFLTGIHLGVDDSYLAQ